MIMYRAGFRGQNKIGRIFGRGAARGTGSEAEGAKFIWGRVLFR